MKKVWLVAWNGLTRTARDRKTLLLQLIFPMLLIGILGSALQSMMGSVNLDPHPVIFINQDTGASPGAQAPALNFGNLLHDVLVSPDVQKYMKVTIGDDVVNAEAAVKAGKAVDLIQVPAGFTAAILSGKPASVRLFSDPGKMEAELDALIVNNFTDAVTNNMLAAASGAAGATPVLPKVVTKSVGARNVTAVQYYAAAMAIMFMLMSGLSRAAALLSEKREGTLARMMVTPTSKATILAGQILGTFLIIFTQFLIILLGTHYIYHVDWVNWGQALLIGGSFALAAAGIGTAVAGLLSEPKAADASVGVVGNLFAALSGSMFPIYFFPDGMKLVAKLIPNYWALQGFLDSMGATGASVLPSVAVLVGLGLLAGAIGTWRMAAR